MLWIPDNQASVPRLWKACKQWWWALGHVCNTITVVETSALRFSLPINAARAYGPTGMKPCPHLGEFFFTRATRLWIGKPIAKP